MKTISQHEEDIKNLMKKVADIEAKCMSENREPNEAELALTNEILDKVEDIKRIVGTMRRHERIANDLNAPANPPLTRPAPRIDVQDRAEQDRFHSLGQQLAAVMSAAAPGGFVDPRLRNGITNAASGLSESVQSDGGFLVQQDFSADLLQEVFKTGVLSSRCRRVPISGNSNSLKINGVDETSRASTRYGGIVGYWLDEAAASTPSKPKFRRIELNLHKLIGLCYATDDVLRDAAALEEFIRQAFVGEFGFLLDDAIMNGSGSGQPLGILNASCLVSVAKETGQLADTLVAENIVKMYSRRFAQQTGNYIWIYNQNVEPQLATMSLAVGTGGIPVYMPPGGLSDSPYARIMGLPAIAIEQCQTLGDQGDIFLANFPNGYVLAEKGGIQTDMSIHVRFLYDESVFRFVMRVDGQPVRASALTPYKGGATSTQSHFITLDARA